MDRRRLREQLQQNRRRHQSEIGQVGYGPSTGQTNQKDATPARARISTSERHANTSGDEAIQSVR